MSDNNVRARERDLILAPNEYAYILDETKGNVINYVGPHKTSLANTDQPVIFNHKSKQFERCNLEQAIRNFAIAPEGWYLVLKNPAKDGHPAKTGTANNLPELNIGRKINIPGPVAFAPWPGQMSQVIQGHRLRSNQYLIVRVYDEEAACANWGKAVIKPQVHKDGDTPSLENPENIATGELPDLTMGKLLVIKGTEISFYIPPTGIEIVPDDDRDYIREAVTLEQLEYCILLDENGSKRYIRGPAVVFPQPTENFIEKTGARKFKAIELNEISGLYIKVIAAYEEDGKTYKVGDELFITGAEQMIYFPRMEHAIVRYGDSEIIYAVAIPAGEARYVLNRLRTCS
jgi:major vault protein